MTKSFIETLLVLLLFTFFISYHINKIADCLSAVHVYRIQKKSLFHGSEPEEDFAFYIVFEEGLVICINNPVSAKFSVNVKSTVKDIALLPYILSRHAQCRVREVWLVLNVLKEEGL